MCQLHSKTDDRRMEVYLVQKGKETVHQPHRDAVRGGFSEQNLHFVSTKRKGWRGRGGGGGLKLSLGRNGQ